MVCSVDHLSSGAGIAVLRAGGSAVDAAIATAVTEPDLMVRTARWREIEAAILADAPVVPLVQLRTVAATSDRLRGLVVRADGSIDLSGVRLGR